MLDFFIDAVLSWRRTIDYRGANDRFETTPDPHC